VKSTVEHLNPTRVKLTVEVGFDELKPHFDKAYGTLGGQVRIPGFRPGKVPARILDARLGRGAILSEVVNDAVPAKYGEAVAAEQLAVLGQPEIEITRIDDGDSVEFTAEVDVRPEIALPAVGEVVVTVDDIQVTDADVDEQVEALQERFATTTTVERPAADGDLVAIDLRASKDGEVIPEATADNLTYRIGSGDLVDGIDEAVTGLSAGESTTFPTSLVAGEHAGEPAEVTVTVNGVSERTLPDADDDFAQLASEFDTVAELRADLAEKIRRVKNLSQAAAARDKVLEALLAMTEVPVPAGALEAEIAARAHDAVHTFDHDESALDAHLASQGQSRDDLNADIRTAAEEAVRTQLLLDALAEASEVGVSQEEFTDRLIYNAQRMQMSPDEYFRRIQEAGQLAMIFAEVRRGKALADAVQRATITDASGNTLDINELFGVEEVDEVLDEVAGTDQSLVSEGDAAGDEAAAEDDDAAGDDDAAEDDDEDEPAEGTAADEDATRS
jgi:trigger factor